MASKPKQFEARLYLGRVDGHDQYEWLGRFATEKERDEALARAKEKRDAEAANEKRPPGERITCAVNADEYLERLESAALLTKSGRPFKRSSIGTARGQLRRFTTEFGDAARVDRAARGNPLG